MTYDVKRFLDDTRVRVDAAIDALLPAANEEPRSIHEALRYAVFSGGKRVRPALLLLAADAVRGRMETHVDAAAGFEMIHTASLILDDLPSQDNAPVRRGRAACHIEFGESTAVLASTALLSLGIGAVALNAVREKAPSRAPARIVRLVADAIGTRGMIGGQIADLALAPSGATMEALEYIHSHKTGALFIACAQAGALLAGGAEAEVAALGDYAKNVGLAYQIADDILDHEGTLESLGKPAGQDSEKATFVGVFGLEVSKRLTRELYETAEGALDILGPRKEKLVALTRWLEARTK
ncbi:MAG: polyprenyl synthetase family protein [bacterium]